MSITDRAARLRIGVATVASGVLAAAAAVALAGPAGAATSGAAAAPGAGYQFVTLGSHHDRTFNQLLGINNEGVIAGYFGIGTPGHPNKGYTILPPYAQGDILSENFPGSVQTQVTGLNDGGVTVGFFSTQDTASGTDNNFGWWAAGGHFHEVNFPTGTPSKPPMDQLLGVNDHDVAVGFFMNASGISRGYTYDINTNTFSRVTVPGSSGLGPSLTAAAINNKGDIAGSYVNGKGVTVAFLYYHHAAFKTLAFPGAKCTTALGVNDHDEVVGIYSDSSAVCANAPMHSFTWTPGGGFTTVDDPNGVGTTTINGVNNAGDLVGFYVDSAGNTDGLLAYPGF